MKSAIRTCLYRCRLGALILVAALAAACSSAVAGTAPASVVAAVPAAHVVLDGSPGTPAANTQTNTIYVPIQCTTSFCANNDAGHVVDVINAATCNTGTDSGCAVVARAAVGSGPLSATVDSETDTVYITNGADGTVSVIDGARCNATVSQGCGKPAATITTGGSPVAAALDPATHTLYVASLQGDIFVVDVAACNATTTSGCAQPVREVADAEGPQSVDVDVATDTVYVANGGPDGTGGTVSVINGAACNAADGSGCARTPRTVTGVSAAWWVAVDQNTNTVYVANNNDGTVSVVNGGRCNGSVSSGCSNTPPTITVGASPSFVVVDPLTSTVFTVNTNDNTLSAINALTCSGTDARGCGTTAPSEQASRDQGAAYNPFPNAAALIPELGAAYLVNVGGANVMSVANISACNAATTAGCRRPAPAIPAHEYLISVDPATGTIYAGNLSQPEIDVLDARTCHVGLVTGCVPVAVIPTQDATATVGAIDDTTHTLYAADPVAGTVDVINTARCNAQDTTGCADAQATVQVGAAPGSPVLNPVTRTLYVPYGSSGDEVAVINAATCNAADFAGCGQPVADVTVGVGTGVLAVSAATDTIYAPSAGTNFEGDTVAVINGATCNATDTAGCGQLAATAQVGLGPFGVAVDDATHTVYVVNNADGDQPGTVSVINGATCNGTDTAGCSQQFPTVATGRSPLLATVDNSTGVLYVTDYSSAGVTVIDGLHCNASVTSGCSAPLDEQPAGSQPFGLAVDAQYGTVYVADQFQDGSVSILGDGSP